MFQCTFWYQASNLHSLFVHPNREERKLFILNEKGGRTTRIILIYSVKCYSISLRDALLLLYGTHILMIKEHWWRNFQHLSFFYEVFSQNFVITNLLWTLCFVRKREHASQWSQRARFNCTENENWMSRAALDSAFCTLNVIVTDIYELAGAPTFFRPRVYTLPHTMARIETIKVRVGGV